MKTLGLLSTLLVAFAVTVTVASPIEINSRDADPAVIVQARGSLEPRAIAIPPPSCPDDPNCTNPGGPIQPVQPVQPNHDPKVKRVEVPGEIPGDTHIFVERIEIPGEPPVIPTGHPRPIPQGQKVRRDATGTLPSYQHVTPPSISPNKVKKDVEGSTVTLPSHHHFTLPPTYPNKVKKDVEGSTVTLPSHHHFTLPPQPPTEPGFFGPKARNEGVPIVEKSAPAILGPKREVECPKVDGWDGGKQCFYGPKPRDVADVEIGEPKPGFKGPKREVDDADSPKPLKPGFFGPKRDVADVEYGGPKPPHFKGPKREVECPKGFTYKGNTCFYGP